MFRVRKMQWCGALVVTVCFFAETAVQGGTWTPLANQPTFLNPPSQCALYPNANCAPPGNFAFGGILQTNLLTDGGVLVEALAVDDNFNFSFLEYLEAGRLTPGRLFIDEPSRLGAGCLRGGSLARRPRHLRRRGVHRLL